MKTTTVTKNEMGSIIQTSVTENNEEQNSIELSRNAKGEIQWKIKVYANTAEEAEKLATEFRKVAESHM